VNRRFKFCKLPKNQHRRLLRLQMRKMYSKLQKKKPVDLKKNRPLQLRKKKRLLQKLHRMRAHKKKLAHNHNNQM
jgi:hypothetical protein